MVNFEAKALPEADHLVVSLSGECDLSVRADLASALADAVNRSGTVVVDLSELTFLDSGGIHEIVTAYHAARGRGGRLYLRNASGVVEAVLEVTGIGKLLDPSAGEDDAQDPAR